MIPHTVSSFLLGLIRRSFALSRWKGFQRDGIGGAEGCRENGSGRGERRRETETERSAVEPYCTIVDSLACIARSPILSLLLLALSHCRHPLACIFYFFISFLSGFRAADRMGHCHVALNHPSEYDCPQVIDKKRDFSKQEGSTKRGE